MKSAVPVTPFHVVPTATVYFLFFRRLNGLAFFLGSLLIDLEPVLYMFFSVRFQFQLLLGGFAQQGPHMITHNPFSAVLLVAPVMVVVAKAVELASRGLMQGVFPDIHWVKYSWKATYLSALTGAFLHLGWDLTMHFDINLGFPFIDLPNPFINAAATALILYVSLALMLPAYLIGKKINTGDPCRKLP